VLGAALRALPAGTSDTPVLAQPSGRPWTADMVQRRSAGPRAPYVVVVTAPGRLFTNRAVSTTSSFTVLSSQARFWSSMFGISSLSNRQRGADSFGLLGIVDGRSGPARGKGMCARKNTPVTEDVAVFYQLFVLRRF
jgi:hypothetical protein